MVRFLQVSGLNRRATTQHLRQSAIHSGCRSMSTFVCWSTSIIVSSSSLISKFPLVFFVCRWPTKTGEQRDVSIVLAAPTHDHHLRKWTVILGRGKGKENPLRPLSIMPSLTLPSRTSNAPTVKSKKRGMTMKACSTITMSGWRLPFHPRVSSTGQLYRDLGSRQT